MGDTGRFELVGGLRVMGSFRGVAAGIRGDGDVLGCGGGCGDGQVWGGRRAWRGWEVLGVQVRIGGAGRSRESVGRFGGDGEAWGDSGEFGNGGELLGVMGRFGGAGIIGGAGSFWGCRGGFGGDGEVLGVQRSFWGSKEDLAGCRREILGC